MVVHVFKRRSLIIKGVHYLCMSIVQAHGTHPTLTGTTFRTTAVLLLAKRNPVELMRVCRRARAAHESLDIL